MLIKKPPGELVSQILDPEVHKAVAAVVLAATQRTGVARRR